MDKSLIGRIVPELEAALIGRRFGRVFQPSRSEFVIDLRLNDSKYLFISIDPGRPGIFLATRRLKELDKASINSTAFVMQVKKQLSNGVITSVARIPDERAVVIELDCEDELGGRRAASLVVQLTGRSSNLFILDEHEAITDRARETNGTGQQIGDVYSPPHRAEQESGIDAEPIDIGEYGSLSEFLDRQDQENSEGKSFDTIAKAAKQRIGREIAKREKLVRNLDGDLAEHGDGEKWKRFGDLLLANTGTAKRDGENLIVTDYFDEAVPMIEIPADENDSITETAEKYFRRYTKARNAAEEIEKRKRDVEAELKKLRAERERIDAAIEAMDADYLVTAAGGKKPLAKSDRRAKQADTNASARKFLSSDGFEILVGKKAKDNDHLTFRIAKSLDTWMHAADYPGSHVVVRSRSRQEEVPQRTLLEAAQLAAFYSQGKKQPKAAVHYTLKKFVNKPKGAAPGLVSLSSFKTILVEPIVPDLERL